MHAANYGTRWNVAIVPKNGAQHGAAVSRQETGPPNTPTSRRGSAGNHAIGCIGSAALNERKNRGGERKEKEVRSGVTRPRSPPRAFCERLSQDAYRRC